MPRGKRRRPHVVAVSPEVGYPESHYPYISGGYLEENTSWEITALWSDDMTIQSEINIQDMIRVAYPWHHRYISAYFMLLHGHR